MFYWTPKRVKELKEKGLKLTYQDETKGFGVFATCSGAYNRSRLLTVAHYPTNPDHKVALENLVQAAGLGAKVLKVMEKDGALLGTVASDEWNKMPSLLV